MGVPTSEVGYTSVTTGMGIHEVHKGHVVLLGGKTMYSSTNILQNTITDRSTQYKLNYIV
jgi:hypothetical protein